MSPYGASKCKSLVVTSKTTGKSFEDGRVSNFSIGVLHSQAEFYVVSQVGASCSSVSRIRSFILPSPRRNAKTASKRLRKRLEDALFINQEEFI